MVRYVPVILLCVYGSFCHSESRVCFQYVKPVNLLAEISVFQHVLIEQYMMRIGICYFHLSFALEVVFSSMGSLSHPFIFPSFSSISCVCPSYVNLSSDSPSTQPALRLLLLFCLLFTHCTI